MLTTLNFAHLPSFNKQDVTVHHLVAALFKKYKTIYPFGENNETGFQSRQVPVWKGLISIVSSVIL